MLTSQDRLRTATPDNQADSYILTDLRTATRDDEVDTGTFDTYFDASGHTETLTYFYEQFTPQELNQVDENGAPLSTTTAIETVYDYSSGTDSWSSISTSDGDFEINADTGYSRITTESTYDDQSSGSYDYATGFESDITNSTFTHYLPEGADPGDPLEHDIASVTQYEIFFEGTLNLADPASLAAGTTTAVDLDGNPVASGPVSWSSSASGEGLIEVITEAFDVDGDGTIEEGEQQATTRIESYDDYDSDSSAAGAGVFTSYLLDVIASDEDHTDPDLDINTSGGPPVTILQPSVTIDTNYTLEGDFDGTGTIDAGGTVNWISVSSEARSNGNVYPDNSDWNASLTLEEYLGSGFGGSAVYIPVDAPQELHTLWHDEFQAPILDGLQQVDPHTPEHAGGRSNDTQFVSEQSNGNHNTNYQFNGAYQNLDPNTTIDFETPWGPLSSFKNTEETSSSEPASEPTEGEGTEGEECNCACGEGLSPALTAIHTYEIWDDGGTPEFPDDDVLIGYAVTEFYGEPWGNTTIYDTDGNEVEPDENGEYPPQYNAQNSDWRLINAENFGTVGGAQAIGNALSKEQKKPDYQISQVASAVTTFAGTVAQVLLTGTVPLAEAGIKYNKIKEEKVGIAEIIIVHRLDTDVYIVTKKKNGSIVSSRVIRDRTLAEVEAMTAADMLQIASTGVADGLEKTGGAAVYAVMLFLPFDEGYFVFKGVQYLYKGGKLLKKVGDKYIELAGDELKRSVKAIKENVEKIKNCLKPIAKKEIKTSYGRYVRRADEFKHALDPDHVRAAAREKAGEVVKLKPDGVTPYDHLSETRSYMSGARRHIINLKKHLSDPNLSASNRAIIEAEIRELSGWLDNAEEILGELAR